MQSSGVAETGMSADVGDDDSGEISQALPSSTIVQEPTLSLLKRSSGVALIV